MSDRGLYQIGKRWYLRIAVHGRMQRFGKPHGFPTKEAARIFRDRLTASLRERAHFPGSEQTGDTLAELRIAYLATILGKRASYRDIALQLQFWADRFPSRPVLSLHPSDISIGISELGQRVSGTTANCYAANLRAMMRRMVKPFSWVLDFWRDVERFPSAQRVMPIYTMEDVQRVFQAAEERDAFLIYLNLLIGVRRATHFSLRWEWVQWEHQLLQLPTIKRQKAFALPLSAVAVAIFDKLHREQGRPRDGWVFPARWQNSGRVNPRIHMDPHNWYNRTFKPLLRGLGLSHLTFHALRRTWATVLGKKAPQRIVQALGNWADIRVVGRYTIPQEDSMRAGMEWVAESFRTATLLPAEKNVRSENDSNILIINGKRP